MLWLLTGLTLAATAALVAATFVAFPPFFTGWGELTPAGTIDGWVVNRSSPSARVEVELYVDGEFVAHAAAERPRPDVSAAGWAADERCGYSFPLPRLAPGEHTARVYAMHTVAGGTLRTLQQTGDALHFSAGADGRVSPAPPR
jgi:hypothetical protein